MYSLYHLQCVLRKVGQAFRPDQLCVLAGNKPLDTSHTTLFRYLLFYMNPVKPHNCVRKYSARIKSCLNINPTKQPVIAWRNGRKYTCQTRYTNGTNKYLHVKQYDPFLSLAHLFNRNTVVKLAYTNARPPSCCNRSFLETLGVAAPPPFPLFLFLLIYES